MWLELCIWPECALLARFKINCHRMIRYYIHVCTYIQQKELRRSDFMQTDLIGAFLKDFFRVGYQKIKTHFNKCVYDITVKRYF